MNTVTVNISPPPKHIHISSHLRPHPAGIVCHAPSWEMAGAYFTRDLQALGVKEVSQDGIRLCMDASLPHEAYEILIDEQQVLLRAGGIMGINHAMSTVLQMAQVENGALCLPDCKIADAPDKEYRGLMVDLARHPHPFGALLDYVDLCRIYKASTLHLHFADDQGWCLPSEAFPLLTSPARSYTRQEIRQLTAYARRSIP